MGAAEERRGGGHVPVGEQRTDPRRRDRLAAARVEGDGLDVEARRACDRAQQRHVARAVVAEAEVLADDDRRGAQLADEHALDERRGGGSVATVASKPTTHAAVDPERRRAARGGARPR